MKYSSQLIRKVLVASILCLSLSVGIFSRLSSADESLDRNAKHLTKMLTRMVDADTKSTDKAKVIFSLREFPFYETTDAIFANLDFILHSFKNEQITAETLQIITASLKTLGVLATEEQIPYLESLKESLFEALGSENYSSIMDTWIVAAINGAKKRKDPLPILADLLKAEKSETTIESPMKDETIDPEFVRSFAKKKEKLKAKEESRALVVVASPSQYRAQFEKTLNERVIGQPEAIEVLSTFQMKSKLYGSTRTTSEALMLMGLPGTGKDTIAEAYTDAIHEEAGAYHEHMFRFPAVRNDADFWKVYGSNTGYVGSEHVSPFFKFLVRHSGGRYIVREEKSGRGDTSSYIIENPDWKPGMTLKLTGYYAPEEAVVFVNEFHNWPKILKDRFLKEALEKGFFSINNPGKGVHEIHVPVTFLIASNDGIPLLAARELSGARYGKPLPYDELLAKWEKVHKEPKILKDELLKTNGPANTQSGSESLATGYSEELINRIQDSHMLLLRPLSPENIREILKQKISVLKSKLSQAAGFSLGLEITWTEKLVGFMQEYQYIAEDGARPTQDRLDNLIERTILDAISKDKIKEIARGTKQYFELDVDQNQDNTSNLVFRQKETENADSKTLQEFKHLIPITLKNKDKGEIDPKQLEELLTLGEKLNSQVFGAETVVDRLAELILVTEERTHNAELAKNVEATARVLMFLGLSSTGKTELSKALARSLYKDESAVLRIDFGQIQSVQKMEALILGSHDGSGNGLPSEFMKRFDRHNGKLVVVADELANAPKEVLKALYDLFREPIVYTFSDRVERRMGGVTFIATGNVGEEWFKEIPRNIDRDEQRFAFEEVYREAMKKPGFWRVFLERYFSEALINRVGVRNIFFFSPLNFKATRNLTQYKLLQSLKALKKNSSETKGWNIVFADEQNFYRAMEVIEGEGFEVREQGASIDRFIKDEFETRLRKLLLTAKAPSNSEVVLSVKENEKEITFQGKVSGMSEPILLVIRKIEREPVSQQDTNSRIQTAYHEAGHEIVRQVLNGDKFTSDFLSIIPGVTDIDGQMIRYLGLARYFDTQYLVKTREAVIALMAGTAGGGVAQSMITRGQRTDAGKGNDAERMTQIAQTAILEWGLSKQWGWEAIPTGMDTMTYISSLSDAKKRLYETELKKMIDESIELARQVLVANFDNALAPLAIELAEKGTLEKEDLEKFYKGRTLYHPKDQTWTSRVGQFAQKFTSKLTSSYWFKKPARDGEFLDWVPMPKKVADIKEFVAKKKAEGTSQVPPPAEMPVATPTDCNAALKPKQAS